MNHKLSQFLLLWLCILAGLGLLMFFLQSIFVLFGPKGLGVFVVLCVTGGIAWTFSDL